MSKNLVVSKSVKLTENDDNDLKNKNDEHDDKVNVEKSTLSSGGSETSCNSN